MSDLSGKDISGQLVNQMIGSSGSLPVPELVAYFKGARIALRFVQGVAEGRESWWLAATLADALDRLPGGDNPGHHE